MGTHQGGCHCGQVRYEVIAPTDLVVRECNCSICSKSGYLHLLVLRERFKLLKGEDSLTSYTFNTGVAQHYFCSICGVKSFYIPRSHPEGYSINVRCIDSDTITSLKIQPFNGADWEAHIDELREGLAD